MHAQTFQIHTKNNGLRAFSTFGKSAKKYPKNRTKKASKIVKNHEKHTFEIMLFFTPFFASFLVDFGSILDSILLSFWRFFPPKNQAFFGGGREGHFSSILSDFECFLDDFWMIFG